jgi:acetate kinase
VKSSRLSPEPAPNPVGHHFHGPLPPSVLTLNGGSSSIRFALYDASTAPRLRFAGLLDRIGQAGSRLTVHFTGQLPSVERRLPVMDHRTAIATVLEWLEAQPGFRSVAAAGHRVVHGMQHFAPEPVTPELLAELRRITPYAPDHLPRELELIEVLAARYPRLPQVACFDTAFHQDLPRVAQMLPLPRRYEAQGVRRYGFHGLSYAFLLEELARVGDPAATRGRVILAHLGNGASLAAVRDGRSQDTSMGFTPTAGLPMGTRSGDLDPGLVRFLARSEHLSPDRFHELVNHESGLLGVSETSSDMRELLDRESGDLRAAEAIGLFCYQTRKWIGSFAAVLGGVDTLVFAGGIGEHAPAVRSRICEGLTFLGLELDPWRNATNASVISTDSSPATVRVLPTDEGLMIARSVCRTLHLGEAAPPPTPAERPTPLRRPLPSHPTRRAVAIPG